jgi:hypothetical protein
MATRQLILDQARLRLCATPLVKIFEIWHSIKYGLGVGTTALLGEENALRDRQID